MEGDSVIVEEVAKVVGDVSAEGGVEDDVFESVEVVDIGGGGEGGIGGGDNVPNVIGGGGEICTEEPIGEKEKGASPKGEVSANIECGGVDGATRGAVEGTEGHSEGGGAGGDGEFGDGGVGVGIDLGGGEGGSESPNISNYRCVPLITRRRLWEILAHAEGECIMLVYVIMCM